MHWDRPPDLVSDPSAWCSRSDQRQRGVRLQGPYLLGELAVSLGLPAGFQSPDEPVLRLFNDNADLFALDDADQLTTLHLPLIEDPLAELALQLYPVRDAGTGKYTGIAAAASFGSTIDIPLGDRFHLLVKLSAIVADGLGMKLSRAGGFTFSSSLFSGTPANLADSVQLGARVGLESVAASERKLVSLGTPGGMQLEIGSGSLSSASRSSPRPVVRRDRAQGGKARPKSADADGFLGSCSRRRHHRQFNLGLGIANDAACTSRQLRARDPPAAAPRARPGRDPYLTLGATFKAGEIPVTPRPASPRKLGPLAAVVEDIGVKATFVVKGDRSGNLGPLDVAFGFKPPNGVGLSIDAGVVKGGGYLYFDFDAGEYAGALELTIADFLSLKAIGLITTRMPDGSQGFSLLIIITAEFGPGLQLGFGFTLIGVGGLLGLNRTMRAARRSPRACARARSTGSCSRPTSSPTRRASSATCATIFPPYSGPLPDRPDGEARLGHADADQPLARRHHRDPRQHRHPRRAARSILPDEDAAVLKLQVNFIGAIEFDKKRVWFFAALFDSRLLFITLEGEMGVLVAVGDDANFVLSVGGFHPRFSPPPLPFPSPRRIALDDPRHAGRAHPRRGLLRVTTNTVQFGARAELFFGFDSVQRRGPHGVRRAVPVLAVLLHRRDHRGRRRSRCSASGCSASTCAFSLGARRRGAPAARGSIALLFFEISARLRRDLGRGGATRRCRRSRSCRYLAAELEKAENWRALPPPSRNLLVSLRKLDLPGDDARAASARHARGQPERGAARHDARQGRRAAAVGRQPLHARRDLGAASSDGATRDAASRPRSSRSSTTPQKLSRRRSSTRTAASSSASTARSCAPGRAVQRTLRYEVTIIDTRYRRFVQPLPDARSQRLFAHLIKGSARRRSVRARSAQRNAGAAVRRHDRASAMPATPSCTMTRQPRGRRRTRELRERGARRTSGSSERAAGDPSARAELHVIPADRDERGRMSRRDYSFLPWARQGLANRITRRTSTPARQAARDDRRRADARRPRQLDGADATSRLAAARRSSTAPATSSASTRARSSAPSRATGSRTSSPTTSPRSSSTTRTSPGATRPAAPDATGARLRPGSRSSCSPRASSPTARRRRAAGRCPFIDVTDAALTALLPGRPSCGRGRTCTSTAALRRATRDRRDRP